MTGTADEKVMQLRSDEDIVRLRQLVREHMVAAGFSLIDQTKMVTASSELARNTLRYGGGGEARLARVANGLRQGIALSFEDQGPGIPDLALALKDGYTTGGGMGLGLSGAKRLTDEFDIQSTPGEGTTVRICKWKPY
jgi:serine/threonine-protein kinase RsbT